MQLTCIFYLTTKKGKVLGVQLTCIFYLTTKKGNVIGVQLTCITFRKKCFARASVLFAAGGMYIIIVYYLELHFIRYCQSSAKSATVSYFLLFLKHTLLFYSIRFSFSKINS